MLYSHPVCWRCGGVVVKPLTLYQGVTSLIPDSSQVCWMRLLICGPYWLDVKLTHIQFLASYMHNSVLIQEIFDSDHLPLCHLI